MTENLLTADDVARVLGVSRTSAYELLRTGRIASVHIGRSVRCTVATLDAYIANGGHRVDGEDERARG